MNRRDSYIFTHFTEIADAKQRDIRRLQAETTFSTLQSVGAALRTLFNRLPLGNSVKVADQA